MNIFRNLENLPTFKNAVVTIGSFDGVHVGHQEIIARVNDLAKQRKGESVLFTFHPHPRMVVNENYQIQLLSPLEEKFELLKKYGLNNVVVAPFTRTFSEQSPEAYILDFLVAKLQAATIVIGYNHRFGKNRVGDIHLLKKMGEEHGFEVAEISKQLVDDLSVSSTKIRNALLEGEVATACALLGHDYFIKGIVVKGNQLGRKIGFPTANILVEDESKLVPAHGVYAVKVYIRGQLYHGMLNIGVRPTVAGKGKTIEVNIFDFEQNIYGEQIQVEFVYFIRKEQKFENLQALIAQLSLDKQNALFFLTKK